MFSTLGQRFDMYSGGLPSKVGDAIQKALAEWQDFFYSGSWPDLELLRWSRAYETASAALESAISAGAKKVSGNSAVAASKALGPLFVGAGDPLSMPDLPQPKGWQIALLLIPMAWVVLQKGK